MNDAWFWMTTLLLSLKPLWGPFAPLDPVHLDLNGVTFIWPAAITLQMRVEDQWLIY